MDLQESVRQVNRVVNADNEQFSRELLQKINALTEQLETQREQYEAEIETLKDYLSLAKTNAHYDASNTSEFISHLRTKLDGVDVQNTQQYHELYRRYRRLCEEHHKMQIGQHDILRSRTARLESVYYDNLGKMEQCILELRQRNQEAEQKIAYLQYQNETLKLGNSQAALRISSLEYSNLKSRTALRDTTMSIYMLYPSQSIALVSTVEQAAYTNVQSMRSSSTHRDASNDAVTPIKRLEAMIMYYQRKIGELTQKLGIKTEKVQMLENQLHESRNRMAQLQNSVSIRENEASKLQQSVAVAEGMAAEMEQRIYQQKLQLTDFAAKAAKVKYLEEQVSTLAQSRCVKPTYVDKRGLQYYIYEAYALLHELKPDSEDAEALRRIIQDAQAAMVEPDATSCNVDFYSAVLESMLKAQYSELSVRVRQLAEGLFDRDAGAILAAFRALSDAFRQAGMQEAVLDDMILQDVQDVFRRVDLSACAGYNDSSTNNCSQTAYHITKQGSAPDLANYRLVKKYLCLKAENEKYKRAILESEIYHNTPAALHHLQKIVFDLYSEYKYTDSKLERCQKLLFIAQEALRTAIDKTMHKMQDIFCEFTKFKIGVLDRGNALIDYLNKALAESYQEVCLMRDYLIFFYDYNHYLRCKLDK